MRVKREQTPCKGRAGVSQYLGVCDRSLQIVRCCGEAIKTDRAQQCSSSVHLDYSRWLYIAIPTTLSL
jgi:hypothetical protein